MRKKDIKNSRDNNNQSNINKESQNNESLNCNLNLNVFFGIYNQKNQQNIDKNNNINKQNLIKNNNFFNDDDHNLINSDDIKDGDKDDNLYKKKLLITIRI